MLPGGLYTDSGRPPTHLHTHTNVHTITRTHKGPFESRSAKWWRQCWPLPHTKRHKLPDKYYRYEEETHEGWKIHQHEFSFTLNPICMRFTVLWDVSASLPSISLSVSMCKLQRQHHMAPDSFHTFSLCSTKLLKPCQREKRERHTHTESSASRVPICLWWFSVSCQGLCQVYMFDLISQCVHLPVFICQSVFLTVELMCLSGLKITSM